MRRAAGVSTGSSRVPKVVSVMVASSSSLRVYRPVCLSTAMLLPGPLRSPAVADAAMVVTWSSGFIGAELCRRAGADPITLLAWRFLLLALILVAVCRASGRPWPGVSSWRRQTVIGVLCQPAYLVL